MVRAGSCVRCLVSNSRADPWWTGSLGRKIETRTTGTHTQELAGACEDGLKLGQFLLPLSLVMWEPCWSWSFFLFRTPWLESGDGWSRWKITCLANMRTYVQFSELTPWKEPRKAFWNESNLFLQLREGRDRRSLKLQDHQPNLLGKFKPSERHCLNREVQQGTAAEEGCLTLTTRTRAHMHTPPHHTKGKETLFPAPRLAWS